jgi:NAD(P)-dependent dehydrogenase (short-subunit alcohol dehydrogenase family)
MKWSPDAIGSQAGRTIIVTGANAGIGFETAKVLAAKSATVFLACRNPANAAQAVERIKALNRDARVEARVLDLASLASIRSFAAEFAAANERLDVLINNAGVMTPPLGRTADGFETQFGTNFIGHFLLTMLLLPCLNRTPKSRVVTLSSVSHWVGEIDFNNLNAEKGYSKFGAYAQSKLANLIFVYELQRRLDESGAATISTGAHPGVTASELSRHNVILGVVQRAIAQPTIQGAMPSLRAAMDPTARGGDYYGPGGVLTLTLFGGARKQTSSSRSRDKDIAARLWSEAEGLCGQRYPTLQIPISATQRSQRSGTSSPA